MKVSPNRIKQRADLDLKQGIKSSLPEVKELFALTFALYLSNDKNSVVQYSNELDNPIRKIEITNDLVKKLELLFSSQLSDSNKEIFIKSINSNPLLISQLEPLQVILELFWKLGKISFVDNFPASHERTGGQRFNKKIEFSTNIILLEKSLTDSNNEISQDLLNLLFNWIVKSGVFPQNENVLDKIRVLLTIFSEETHCKVRTISGEIYFQQEGIYEQLLTGNTVINQDVRENVGPFRILKSFIKSDLHKYLKEDSAEGFALKITNHTEFKEYADAVKTFLNLTPKRTFVQIENYNESDLADSLQTDNRSKQIIFYGAPGTGKSHKVKTSLKDVPEERKEIVTFHPEYDNASFVGGYKPFSEFNAATNTDEIKYKFVPQVFTNIYLKAWRDGEKKDHYLVIEEINRGNCAEIFGDIFQLLDRKYNISPSKELKEYLQTELGAEHEGIAGGKMRLPDNLTILATMNTSDQSLFPMDSAFKRRWNWEYVPIEYHAKNEDGTPNESFGYEVKVDETTVFRWIDFIREVNSFIRKNPNLGMDKCIGNYFVKPAENEISIEEFIQKVIFYLWNDVFKDEEESIFERDVFYEDFFPIKTEGVENVKAIIDKLDLPVEETEPTAAAEPVAENENTD